MLRILTAAAIAALLAQPALAQKIASPNQGGTAGGDVRNRTLSPSSAARSSVGDTSSTAASEGGSADADAGDTDVLAISPPALAAGANPCAVSASGGGGAMGFGVSLGRAWSDAGCDRRATAATLAGLGRGEAAILLMCGDPAARAALVATGTACPAQERPRVETDIAGRDVYGREVRR